MLLSEYIKEVIKELPHEINDSSVTLDVGLVEASRTIHVVPASLNRIKFTLKVRKDG